MLRKLSMAACAVAVTIVLSSFAVAQYRDDDDDYYGEQGNAAQARQYGYQSGYRDGIAKGRHEGRENDPNDFRSREWESASRGYQPWMGRLSLFRLGYREGYRAGFQAGYQNVNRGWGDGDSDDRTRVYDRGSYGYHQPWFRGNGGYNIGYQDGSSVARQDVADGKPYNPNPRGRYDDEDHGYRREYGDKHTYQTQYANGYRAGYESTFGRRGY